MVNTSSEFRASHNVLFKAPVLPGLTVKQDFSAGWGTPCSLGSVDVVDLNGNGQADRVDKPETVALTEPVLLAPSWSALEQIAQRKGTEVLTESDLPSGVFLGDPVAVQHEEAVENRTDSIRPLSFVAAQHASADHPETHWAIDVASHELLIFSPRA